MRDPLVMSARWLIVVGAGLNSTCADAAVLTWSNPLGGQAHMAGNWSPVQPPVAGDVLQFNFAGAYGVTYSAAMPSVASATYSNGANVTATAASPHVCGHLTINSGATFALASGSMSAPSSIVVGGARGAAATLKLQGDSTLSGPLTLSPGVDIGATTGTGIVNITGGSELELDFEDNSVIDIGDESSSTGTLTISGVGPGDDNRSSLTAFSSDMLIATQGGTGTLHVINSALVECDDIFAGGIAGSQATIHVAGEDPLSTSNAVIVCDDLNIGYNGGIGTMHIGDAGSVTADQVRVGPIGAIGSGTLTIDPGGSLYCQELDVRSPNGVLHHLGGEITIETGGGLINTDDAGFILSGVDPSSPPTITLIFSADITPDGNVILGAGRGTFGAFNIFDFGTSLRPPAGAMVSIGDAAGSTGVFIVADGAISNFHGNPEVIVGNGGLGVLEAYNGEVFASELRMAALPGSSGWCYLEGGGATMTIADDLIVAGTSAAAGGGATLAIAESAEVIVGDDARVWANGKVDVMDASIAVSGEFDLRGWLELSFGGSATAVGGLTIHPTGALTGHGAVLADVLSSGVISPGDAAPLSDPIGALVITGSVVLSGATSSMLIDMQGPAAEQRDQVIVTGSLTLDGAITATALDGYLPAPDTQVAIISANSIIGTFDSVSLPDELQIIYGPTDVFLRRETCAADVSGGGDGQVNVSDLLAVISAWGTCRNCPPAHCAADIAPVSTNGDCSINVSDLLAVISGWGACP